MGLDMTFSKWVVWLGLISCQASAQATVLVDVPAGDFLALHAAISDANGRQPGERTIISTAGVFRLHPGELLPPIKNDISIRSDSYVKFTAAANGPNGLFHVEEGGSLRLSDMEVSGFSLSQEGTGLIENRGTLYMERIQISSVYGYRFCLRFVCQPIMPAIVNHRSGYLYLDQVSVIESGTTSATDSRSQGLLLNEGTAQLNNVQMYLTEQSIEHWVTPIRNFNDLTLNNSSFMYFDPDGSSSRAENGAPTLELIASSDEAKSEVVNSIVAGFSGTWCQYASSLGHNLVDSRTCVWSSVGDLVGVPSGLIWRTVENNRWGKEFLTHALMPSAASAAVDSADPDVCSSHDLLGRPRNFKDGNGDGNEGCDRGAVELQPMSLAEGGINGLYYDPASDGHYIYILETDFTTLVVWTTFDRKGNQAWVFGTGELVNGRSVTAETYINRNEGSSLEGEITESEAEPWGRIEVDMTSCMDGQVNYYSHLPEFGSGRFSVTRLAYTKQLGCIDSD
jgi:hypothetical protein